MKAIHYATGAAIVLLGMLSASVGQAQVNERTLRLAVAGTAGGHPGVTGAEKWAELIAAKSGGKLALKVFGQGQLGGDVQALSAVQGGTIDFTVMNSGILQGIQKEFAIFDFPFMFDSGEEADPILDGAFGKKLGELLPAKNLYHLAYWELGFRQVTNSRREIKTLEDFSGLKLRVIQSPIYIETFSALGANPVPMAFPEVYTALEQRIIDGQENPPAVIETGKFQEIQRFLTLTNHMYNPQSVLASKKKWDALTQDEQDILTSTLVEATQWQRENSRRNLSQKSLTNLKKSMTVSTLPPEEVAKIRARLKPVIDKFGANVGPELVKELQDALDKGRAK
ncbi:MAG: TRAP transporter substrate-binding protein [Candidatus Accumulibacter sp.]|jgi:tripartite ATP-independent transporter DctP family solute receptor|nr:TRAP transporter substrate-binding protein [Accumulibacter sp.]